MISRTSSPGWTATCLYQGNAQGMMRATEPALTFAPLTAGQDGIQVIRPGGKNMIEILMLKVLGNPPTAGAVALGVTVGIFLATLAFCVSVIRSKPSSADTDALIEELRVLCSRRAAARPGVAARIAADDELCAFTGIDEFQSVDSLTGDADRWDESSTHFDFALNEFGDPHLGVRSMDERLD